MPFGTNLDEFDNNTAWKLTSISMETESDDHHGFGDVTFPTITFVLRLTRVSDIIIHYLYLPNLFFNIITIVQFLLPCDSKKKITLGEMRNSKTYVSSKNDITFVRIHVIRLEFDVPNHASHTCSD